MLNEAQKNSLSEGAKKFGIELNDVQVEQFSRFTALLYEWNEKINLTRIPQSDVVPLHFLDSLSSSLGGDFKKSSSLIDIGTGAGFPGIPLKIAFPHLEVTLLDSTRKKLEVVDVIIRELKLETTRTLHGRAEEISHDRKFRSSFDLAVARAVSDLSELFEISLALLKKGGTLIAQKSGTIDDELDASRFAAAQLGGAAPGKILVSIPGIDVSRTLITVTKLRETDLAYPRHASKIKLKLKPRTTG